MSKEYAIKFVDATQQCISWGDLYNIMNETANETTAFIVLELIGSSTYI